MHALCVCNAPVAYLGRTSKPDSVPSCHLHQCVCPMFLPILNSIQAQYPSFRCGQNLNLYIKYRIICFCAFPAPAKITIWSGLNLRSHNAALWLWVSKFPTRNWLSANFHLGHTFLKPPTAWEEDERWCRCFCYGEKGVFYTRSSWLKKFTDAPAVSLVQCIDATFGDSGCILAQNSSSVAPNEEYIKVNLSKLKYVPTAADANYMNSEHQFKITASATPYIGYIW